MIFIKDYEKIFLVFDSHKVVDYWKVESTKEGDPEGVGDNEAKLFHPSKKQKARTWPKEKSFYNWHNCVT